MARENARVDLADNVIESIAHAHAESLRLSAVHLTYGRSTGFGGNRSALVDVNDLDHGMRLLRSCAVDSGRPMPSDAVRAMLAVRLVQLCTPGAGVEPAVLLGLVEMLNRNALPVVREYGSIGTADLSALCGTALTLMGERSATAPLPPMKPWTNESALPFVSSNALTIGRAILTTHDLRQLVQASLLTFGLSFVGLRGNASPFTAAAARGIAAPGAAELASRMRAVLGRPALPHRLQDPYGLRAFVPSTTGLVDAQDRLDLLLDGLVHAAQENPLFVYDEAGAGVEVVHHGNFLQAPLALSLDTLKIALAQTLPLAVSRLRMMTEPEFTGHRPFLAAGADSASGIMMVEYVVASAYGTIHAAAQPNCLSTVVISRGAEDHASFANEGVNQLERAVHAYRTVIAGELLVAIRLLRQSGIGARDMPSPILCAAYEASLALETNEHDRDLQTDMRLAEEIVSTLAGIEQTAEQV